MSIGLLVFPSCYHYIKYNIDAYLSKRRENCRRTVVDAAGRGDERRDDTADQRLTSTATTTGTVSLSLSLSV